MELAASRFSAVGVGTLGLHDWPGDCDRASGARRLILGREKNVRLWTLTCVIGLGLSACAGAPDRDDRQSGQPRRSAKPSKIGAPGFSSAEARQCMAALAATGISFTALPDQEFGNGCSAKDAVKLLDIGTPVANLGPMTCPLAHNFTKWTQYAVRPAARKFLGSEVVKIESFGTYSCRSIASSTRLSEHGYANAVDISGFVLADGRRITVSEGWNGDPASRAFLRALQRSACRRFGTTLGPDYNAAHRDHLHMDMSGKGYCR